MLMSYFWKFRWCMISKSLFYFSETTPIYNFFSRKSVLGHRTFLKRKWNADVKR